MRKRKRSILKDDINAKNKSKNNNKVDNDFKFDKKFFRIKNISAFYAPPTWFIISNIGRYKKRLQ